MKNTLRKGISGITIGLIAAIIFITIVLPLTVSYIASLSHRYGAQSYEMGYRKYKLLEEKGISACYTKLADGTYIVRINNTLGNPIVVSLIYIKFNNGSEAVKTLEEKINSVGEINLGKDALPEIVKLITSSGAVINVPNCSQLVATKVEIKEISYTKVIEYFITKRYPVNIYIGDKEYPEGITPQPINISRISFYIGRIASHMSSALVILRNNTYLISGIITPLDDWHPSKNPNLLNLLIALFGTADYAPAFIMDSGPAGLKIYSNEAGGYVASVVLLNSTDYVNRTDDYGYYNMSGYVFEYPSSLISEDRFVVKELILNIPYKYSDPDTPSNASIDPLKYVIVNSGYDYLIVGIQTSAFDPDELGWDTIQLNGTIYVNPTNIPSNKNNSKVIIRFSLIGNKVEDSWYHSYNYSFIEVTLLSNEGEINWNCTYREYFKKFETFLRATYQPVLIDQITFPIPQNLLGISGGENVYVCAETAFIAPNGTVYSDSYSDGWVEYVYMPVKEIVNSWVNKYSSSG